jgi:hypothetical protein
MAISHVEQLLDVIEELPGEKVLEVPDFAKFLRWQDVVEAREMIELDAWAENLAKEKGFDYLTEEDVAQIVHELRRER